MVDYNYLSACPSGMQFSADATSLANNLMDHDMFMQYAANGGEYKFGNGLKLVFEPNSVNPSDPHIDFHFDGAMLAFMDGEVLEIL